LSPVDSCMGRKDGTAPLQISAEKNREGRNGS
jgi:hypothetical protein